MSHTNPCLFVFVPAHMSRVAIAFLFLQSCPGQVFSNPRVSDRGLACRRGGTTRRPSKLRAKHEGIIFVGNSIGTPSTTVVAAAAAACASGV